MSYNIIILSRTWAIKFRKQFLCASPIRPLYVHFLAAAIELGNRVNQPGQHRRPTENLLFFLLELAVTPSGEEAIVLIEEGAQ